MGGSQKFFLAGKTSSWISGIKKIFIAVSIMKYLKNPNYSKVFETSFKCFLKSVWRYCFTTWWYMDIRHFLG